MKQLMISAAFVLALPAMANAEGMHRDVVVDGFGHHVRDSFGGCVRTHWHVPMNKCGTCHGNHLAYVFFDFDKWDLRHEAYKTVRKVYDSATKNGEHVMFMIVGHTDTVGTERYNDALSIRRARAVKSELINLGIPASRIKTEGRGFHQLMVITPHGVKESKNRRAEICYSKY